ncbi:unnamed protein product [Alopecurus aequalis]
MDDGTDLHTDVLVDILQRLQPNARRRLRLVCGHWRHAVDTYTVTSLRSRAKTLLITVERAYVFDDDLSQGELSCHLPHGYKVVGTCNGIICMCNNSGGILLHNPVIQDRLAVPSPPRNEADVWIWRRTFNFTYDPATGGTWSYTYKAAGSWCSHSGRQPGGISSYPMVMSFDLNGERAPFVIPLPLPRPAGTWRLMEVLGRLGVAFSKEVWVIEHGASAEAKNARWSRWSWSWHDHQHLTWPHFSHESKHVLTLERLSIGGGYALYRHIASDDTAKAQHGMVQNTQRSQGTLVAHIETYSDTFQRFDFVKTMEPLSVYKC